MATNTAVSSSSGALVTTGGTMSSAAPKDFRQKVSQMLAGIQAVIPDGSSVTVGGQAVAKTDLVNEMTQVLSGYQAVDAGVSATKGARAQLGANLPGFHKQYLGIMDGLISSLGRGNPQLAQFGFTVPKARKPLTSEQQVVRAAKAQKTRALRHTMGKVQKAAVQYTGSLEVSVDETAPAATPANDTAPAAAPAVTQGTVMASAPAETPVPTSHTQ